MDAKTANLFAAAASDDAQFVPSRAATREALESTLKSIAVALIALDYAHHLELGENAQGDLRRSTLGNAYSVTLDHATPPAGMYDRYFHFHVEPDGFTINTMGPKRIHEMIFQLLVDEHGAMRYGTFSNEGFPVRFAPVADAKEAEFLFSKWMCRNFDPAILARAQEWVPKIENQLRLKSPAGPNAWQSPFDVPWPMRRLTA